MSQIKLRPRQLKTKSDAIRTAGQEALDPELCRRETPDFSRWVGLGAKSKNTSPRFRSDDDLWS